MNVLDDNSGISFGPSDRQFVYAVARRIVQNDDDADDIAQDALLRAHRYRDSFRGDSRFRTWLYRIAMTTALGHLRRARRRKEHVSASEIPIEDPSKSAEAQVGDAEVEAVVRRQVARLEPPYRDVIVARANASEAEVAACLGISIANVKVRAHRARKQLKDALERELGMRVAA